MIAELLTLTNMLAFGLALALGLLCWFRWQYRALLRVAAKLPVTLPAWPLLGHGYIMFWGLEEATNYILEMSRRAVEKGYKTICLWVGPLPYLVVHDMEDIRLIMNSPSMLDKGEEYEFFKQGLDSGVGPLRYSLVIAPGPVWKLTRRHMNTLFMPRNLEQMMPAFNNNARVLTERLATRVGRGPKTLDIMDLALDASLKAICDFMFGMDSRINIESKEFKGLKSVIERITENFVKRVLHPWLRWEPMFMFFYKKELQEINSLWKNFTEAPLKDIKDQYELKNNNSCQTKGEEKKNEKEDLLNIVEVYREFQDKNPQFTEADMRAEMLTLYETGSETVATTTSYCLMSLAQYPEYQDKVCDEIDSVVGLDVDVTTDHINKMTYLDQCVKETLRRFTLVPYLLRKPAEDVQLSDCTVPAGCTVVMALNGIHMNPRIYPDPQRFDPDRFTPENEATRDRFAFVPFSGGPRDCIGKKYGMLFIKVILVNILRKYRVKPVMDIHRFRRKLAVALISCEGYNVELEARA